MIQYRRVSHELGERQRSIVESYAVPRCGKGAVFRCPIDLFYNLISRVNTKSKVSAGLTLR